MTEQAAWAQTQARIEKLKQHAQQWHADHPDEADFMPLFACEADPIVEDAETLSRDACEAAHQLIDEILIQLGYMAAEERQT